MEFLDVLIEFQRRRLEFVHTELDTGMMFTEVARTERKLGNGPRADNNMVFAETACSEARRRLNECDPEQMKAEFDSAKSKLEALEAAMAAFRPQN